MKSLKTLLSILFLLCSAPFSFGQTTASVAAWNVKGFDPIPPQRAERIARAIHRMQPDVIALTEVNPDSVAQDITDILADMGDDYWSLIFPQTANQNIALLWKDGVQVSDEQLIPGSDDNQSALRKALTAKVRIRNFDFILIAVHMKSARGATERETRNRQAAAIADFITQETSGNEKDVLLIGDYNMIPGDDDVNFHRISPGGNNNEFLRFVSTEMLAGQASHISSCSPFRGNLLDGYAISANFTREYRTNSLRMIPFTNQVFRQPGGVTLNCTTYTGFISDHLPLIARFRITTDDD